MKKVFLVSCGLVFILSNLFAQDIIYKADGTEIKSKIIEITTETIKYKKFDQLEGPVRNILLSDVFMVIYKDGTREIIKKTELPKNEEIEKKETPIQIPQNIPKTEEKVIVIEKNKELSYGDKCLLGTSDADNLHGKAGNHVLWGIVFGPFAVIGAAVSNPTPEKGNQTPLMSKHRELFNDPAYRSCYTKKARGKNAANAAAGWGLWVLFVIVVVSSVN